MSLFNPTDSRALDRENDFQRAERYRRQLEAVAMNATLGLFFLDERDHCTFMNPAAEHLTGYPFPALPDRPLAEVLFPEGLLSEEAECECPGPFQERGEALLLRSDGQSVPVAFSVCLVREAGRTVGAVLELRDLSAERRVQQKERQLQEELAAHQVRLQSIFQQVPACIAVVSGPEHRFSLVNPPYQQLMGGRAVLGQAAREALPEVAAQGFIDLLDEVRSSGRPFVGREVPIRLSQGEGAPLEERFLNFVYQPLIEEKGAVSSILAFGVDVTEQVRAREVVEQANQAKSDFLTTMSHELRTPLNAMIGYTELLCMGVPEPIGSQARTQVERIGLSARHLLSLIEEILTFSRLEAHRESLDLETVELTEVTENVRALIEPLAQQKGLALEVSLPEEPLLLVTDPRKLRQVLLNLLGNAVKFTETGSVRFLAARDGADLLFRISDSGIGIAPDDLARVFEPFWQAETELHRRVGGTGLGLPVTRHLAEMMGGSVTVESALGEGTTFTVRLPLQAQPRRRRSDVAGAA